MKKLLLFTLAVFLLVSPASAQIHLTTSDEVTLVGLGLDSAGIQQSADSVVVRTYRDGAEVFEGWFNSADAECSINEGDMVFTDAVADIDGAGGDGLYEVRAGFFLYADTLYDWQTLYFYIGVDMADLATALVDIAALNDLSLADVYGFDVTPYDDDSLGTAGERLNRAGDTSMWLDPETDTVMSDVVAVNGSTANADNLVLLSSKLDTLGFLSGFSFGSMSEYLTSVDVDSLAIVTNSGLDTIAWLKRWHPGGGAGVTPDSSAIVSGPDR